MSKIPCHYNLYVIARGRVVSSSTHHTSMSSVQSELGRLLASIEGIEAAEVEEIICDQVERVIDLPLALLH